MALSDDLAGYWSLGEGSASTDAIAGVGALDLLRTGSPGVVTGKVSGARDVNGSNYFTIADDPVFNPPDDFTIALWCKNDTMTFGTSYIILTKDSAGAPTAGCYYIWRPGSNNIFTATVYGSEGYANSTSVELSAITPVADTWYLVVLRHREGNDINLWVNGSSNAAAHTLGVIDNASVFYLGNDPYSRAWDGPVDELGIWHRALSDAEVSELYNSGNGRDLDYILGGEPAVLDAESGSIAISGTANSMSYGASVAAAAGSYSITGSDANLSATFKVSAEPGTFAVTGDDVGLFTFVGVMAETGTYAITGTDAGLTSTRQLAGNSTSYAITGTDATFSIGKTVSAESGTYVITGTDAGLIKTKVIDAMAGSIVITGTDATLTLSSDITLVAESGSYVISGEDIPPTMLRKTFLGVAGSGIFSVTGTNATLTRSEAIDFNLIDSVGDPSEDICNALAKFVNDLVAQ